MEPFTETKMNHFQASPRKRAKKIKSIKAKAVTLLTKEVPLFAAIAICLMPTAGMLGGIGISAAAFLFNKFA